MSISRTGNQNSTQSPHPIVEEAFKNFERIIRPNDDRLFRRTTLEDVRKSAHIISRDQSQRRCLRNLNRIRPLFDLLGKLSGPIDTLCQGTPYLCYIWAPIKLILQIADEHSTSFEKIVNAYAQIAQNLPRFDRLSATFSEQDDFQSTLADVYSDILEFHSHAYQFLRRGGWKILFDASWRSFDSRFNAILRRLDRGRKILDAEAASFEILESRDFRQRILEDLDRREHERRDLQMRDLLLWLDLKGQDREQEELVERRNASREPATCTWFLHNAKVCSWLEDEDGNAFLWLNGKPGSGKTTLAAYMIDEAVFPPTSVILYCLCSYGFGKSETNAYSLTIRSLIAQVVRSRSDLLPHVYDNYVKVGATASLSKTRAVLNDLLSAIESTYLIIDGIDECEVVHQRQIISELFSLASHKHEDHRIKVLVCSRETPEVTRRLGRVPKLSLNEVWENIERDITTFTNTKLGELCDQFDQAIVESIGKEIVSKANGMFLWVKLVLASLLDQGSIQDLRLTISRLPADLYGMYQSILERVLIASDAHQKKRIKFILGLLACSCRPLKIWEVCDFVVFHEGANVLNDQNKLFKNILNLCKPLIEEVDRENIQIVHFSAREFLLEDSSGPYLRSTDVNDDITIACIRYLLTCRGFLLQPLDGEVFDDIVRGYHDIFPYVFEFWVAHMSKSSMKVKKQPTDFKHPEHLTTLFTALAALAEPGIANVETGILPACEFSALQDSSRKPDRNISDFPQIIERYLLYRSKMIQKQNQVVTDLDSHTELILTDPTTLTQMHDNFMYAFERLLDEAYPQDMVQRLDQQQVENFRSRHLGSAFLCRWLGCVWASTGFCKPEERARHEELHKKRFRCPYSDCDSAVGGFTSSQALRKHEATYHTTLSNTTLPPFPTLGGSNGHVAKQALQRTQDLQDGYIQREDEIKQFIDPMNLPGYKQLFDRRLDQLKGAVEYMDYSGQLLIALYSCPVAFCDQKGSAALGSRRLLLEHLHKRHGLSPIRRGHEMSFSLSEDELELQARHLALEEMNKFDRNEPSAARANRSIISLEADSNFLFTYYHKNSTEQDCWQIQEDPQLNPAAQTADEHRHMFSSLGWTRSPRIAVVDNDMQSHSVAEQYLVPRGCLVEKFLVTDAVKQITSDSRFDLIIVAIEHAESMLILQIASQLERMGDFTTILIMLVAGYQPSWLLPKMYRPNRTIQKPITPSSLHAIVEEHCRHLRTSEHLDELSNVRGCQAETNIA